MPQAGYLFKGVCFPDALSARQAACSEFPLTWASDTSVYSLSCSPTIDLESSSMSMCRTTDGGPCATTSQPWPTFPDCNFSGSSDLVLDWGFLAMSLLVVIWGGKRLAALFNTHHVPD